MLILHHYPMSAASRYARLILGEYDETHQLNEIRLWEDDEQFAQVNPMRSLPMLSVESHVQICGYGPVGEYLDETSGAMARERRLMPDDSFQRAEVRRIVDWYLTKLENEVTQYMVHERVEKLFMSADQGGGSPDTATIRAARANTAYHMAYTNWLCGTRSWLAGPMMTSADLAAGAALSVLDYLGEVPFDNYPHVKDWYQRLKSRPSFRAILSDRLRSLAPAAHYADLDF